MEQRDSFGYWLRRRRKALDLTQAALADRVGCATSTIKRIEADERRPSREMALRLAALLGVTEDELPDFIAAARAQGRVDRLEISQALPPAPCVAPNNLPVAPNPLIGREREVEELCALLHADARLLTLIGPGGTGKTRLALHVAAQLLGGYQERQLFPEGIWLIGLAHIHEPAQVLAAVGGVLGLREHDRAEPAAQLAAFVKDKALLLILDNFEQVLDAAPDLAALLEAAPGLRMMVTSRAPLQLRAEREYPVPPLAVPPPLELGDGGGSPAAAALPPDDYPATALFFARLHAARPGLVISQATVEAAAEICRRLDGLPLAIELAAARARVLTPEALLPHLSSPLALLVGGPRDLPARQQTLRSTIAWSYELLDEPAQILFARLAVFSGGWTLSAAEGVAADGQALRPEQILGLLTALVDQSLVLVGELNGKPRFTMLETIREYALERLSDRGEREAIRRKHAQFMLTLVEPAYVELRRAGQMDWLTLLDTEQSNLRGALAWSLEREPELALRLAVSAWWGWGLRGHLREGVVWLDRVLVANPAATLQRARALFGAAMLKIYIGQGEGRELLVLESLDLARAHAAPADIALALILLVSVALNRGELDIAEGHAREAVSLARQCGDAWVLARALLELASIHREARRLAEARSCFAEAVALCWDSGDRWAIASALSQAARGDEGDPALRIASLEEAERLACQVGDRFFQASISNSLGEVARSMGDNVLAERWYERGLSLARRLGNRQSEALILINLGWLYVQQGDLDAAAGRFAHGVAIIGAQAQRPYEDILTIGAAMLALARGDSARAACLLGYADWVDQEIGPALSAYDVSLVAQLRGRLCVALGEDCYHAAHARGQTLCWAEAAREALK